MSLKSLWGGALNNVGPGGPSPSVGPALYSNAPQIRTPVALKTGGVIDYVVNNIVVRTIVYYVVLFGGAWAVSRLPAAQAVVHASMESLLSGGGGLIPGMSKAAAAREIAGAQITETTLALTVAAAMLGAVLLSLPVAWIYTLTRQKRGYQQSVVQTLMILPPLVSGVVVLVKYSVALDTRGGRIMSV